MNLAESMAVGAKRIRSGGIFLLVIIIVWIAAWNGLRLGEAIFFWNMLGAYGANPLYISLSGGIWLIGGLLLAWSVWQGKTWGWIAALISPAGYTIWYWFDRLALQDAPTRQPHANWPFALTANLFFLLVAYLILLSRPTRQFFHSKVYERKPENTTPA